LAMSAIGPGRPAPHSHASSTVVVTRCPLSEADVPVAQPVIPFFPGNAGP
jgi:hypothetical protein